MSLYQTPFYIQPSPVEATSILNGTLEILGENGGGSGTTISISGTPNQVNVTNVSGVTVLSLPQDIATTSSGVTFGSIRLTTGAQAGHLLTCNASGYAHWSLETLSGIIGVDSITGTPNQVITSSNTGNVILSLPQAIAPVSSVTFNALTVSGFRLRTTSVSGNILMCDSVGNGSWKVLDLSGTVLSVDGTVNQIISTSLSGNVTLSLPQNIDTSANVTFNSVQITNDTTVNGTLYVNNGLVALSASGYLTTDTISTNTLYLNASGASAGYVFTSNSSGVGSWQQPSYGVAGAVNQTVISTSGWSFVVNSSGFTSVSGVACTLAVNTGNVVVNSSFLVNSQVFTGQAILGISMDDPSSVLPQNITGSFTSTVTNGSYWNGTAYFSNVTPGNHTFYLSMKGLNAVINADDLRPIYIKAMCV
jgi:hypothetical protein